MMIATAVIIGALTAIGLVVLLIAEKKCDSVKQDKEIKSTTDNLSFVK